MNSPSSPSVFGPQASASNTPSLSFSFSNFLQEALYHPERGFYASARAQIGKQGDFFTNVSVGPIYGTILALVFEEIWQRLGSSDPFFIIEQGANDGRLAHDILEALQKKGNAQLSKSLHYIIVEPFPLLQQQQQATLKKWKNVSWVADNKELPLFEGIYFSNELVDAFPFDLLRWDGSCWLEQRVLCNEDGSFIWTTEPIHDPALEHVAKKLPKTLPLDFLWEVRLGVRPWLKAIAERMQRGVLLVADYGYAGADRFAAYRTQGSIACYEQHRRYDNPLEKVGERDITAHVDFTDLTEAGLEAGWEFLGFTDQHHFLVGAAEEWLRSLEGKAKDPNIQKMLRGLHTLMHPETMGRSFQFLGLGKKMKTTPPLNAFRYGLSTF
ncbi:MAG: SAM-dependent methyltransferase [Chthoniobacterales bacterium]|nr:SAM-dependent methyltransferase [Chthoniobacterales bacterium]